MPEHTPDWRPRGQVEEGTRNAILKWLAEARNRKVKLEEADVWQLAMRAALAAGDVLLLCELTSHWDWEKLQLQLRSTIESVFARLERELQE